MDFASEAPRMTPAGNPLRWRTPLLRLVLTGIVLAIWFCKQSMLGARTTPVNGGIGDALHNLTAGLNSYFAQSPAAANALLILGYGYIDALDWFLLGRWLFAGGVRPFLGFGLLLHL